MRRFGVAVMLVLCPFSYLLAEGTVPNSTTNTPPVIVPKEESVKTVEPIAREPAVATQRPAEGALLKTDHPATNTSSDVTVNWENITLKDCIEILCRDLGMEFVISPSVNVTQEVSVRAGDVTGWTVADKQELFDAILETAGVQRVQRGRVWVFSPSDIRPVLESYKDSKYGDGKPVIGVLKLRCIDAAQAEPFLNTVGGKPPRVFAMKGSRMILVLGTQKFLAQMEELVKLIDIPAGTMTPYTLTNALSDDVVRELAAVFYGRIGGDGDTVRFISVPRLNTIIAHNVPETMTEEVNHWVKLLDQTGNEGERITRVYRLQVIDADTIGKTLDALYSALHRQALALSRQQGTAAAGLSKSAVSTGGGKYPVTASAARPAPPAPAPGAAAAVAATAARPAGSLPTASPDMEEEAVILADRETNTLIVNATPDQHRDIERTILELDKPRRQVLIETVLVEVTLDENLDLGIEWAVGAGKSMTLQQAGLGMSSFALSNAVDGLSYLFKSSEEKMSFIHAAERDDRLHVLSSPTVLTRDGMMATVSFGQEVPIQEKTTSGGGTSQRDDFSYAYKDAKITLTVTPVIDDTKMVTLTLTQMLRQVDPNFKPSTAGNEFVPPIFTTRELSSNLQVENGQTLVLGGLIQRADQQIQQGIPWLSRIPYIGWLFGRTVTVKKGSEILMILTPYVIDSREDSDRLSREFREKILGAMSKKDVRSLYSLGEKTTPTGPPVTKTAPVRSPNEPVPMR